MTDSPFLQIRMRRGRFKEAELPFFILGDLAPLQDMVVDVAKWRFKNKQARQRSPSSFNRIYLKLVGLHAGSTVAEIGIGTTRTILDGAPVPHQEYFKEAVKDIVDIIRLAEQGSEHLNGHMPPRYMAHFNHIGRSLRGNEEMELVFTNQHKARLTQQSRKVLVCHSGDMITQDMTIRGVIFDVNLKNMKFQLQPIHGPSTFCPFLERHKELVVEALKKYKKDGDSSKMYVQVQVVGAYDVQDRLQIVEPAKSVDLLDPLDVSASLDEFRSLHDGWLGGEGKAPDHDGLDWLSDAFERHYPDDLQLPRTYPMADGGISLEWSLGVREADIEIDLKNHVGGWYVFNKDTEQGEEEKTLELEQLGDWEWVSRRLRSLTESSEHG